MQICESPPIVPNRRGAIAIDSIQRPSPNLSQAQNTVRQLQTAKPTPQRPKRVLFANIGLLGQPGAKQAKKNLFRIRSNSIRHAPRGVEGHKDRTLRCGVSELAELYILREISKSQILAVFGLKNTIFRPLI